MPSSTVIYQSGDIIYQEGDEKKELYLVLDGTVSLIKKDKEAQDERIVAEKDKGTLLGSISFVLGEKKTSKAVAKTLVKCTLITEEQRDLMLEKIPNWFKLLVKDLIKNLKATYGNLSEIREKSEKLTADNIRMKQEIEDYKNRIEKAKSRLAELKRLELRPG